MNILIAPTLKDIETVPQQQNYPLKINRERLLKRIAELGQIGAIEGGGVCRLAFTAEDKLGRDQVIAWMKDLDLSITIDAIGNVVATRAGLENLPPVMTGSHIDTVRTGGKYDGNLGVLAGLEVIASLNDANIQTKHPIAVAFFSNEEGSRFPPDTMGSLVFQGELSLQDAYSTVGIDGSTVKENLERIGYLGEAPVGLAQIHAFIELHVEQGPVLEHEQISIGAVTGVQGIHWLEFTILGTSNHAGTTPMHLRHDAGIVAMQIASFARNLVQQVGQGQLVTIGQIQFSPNLVNVIPNKAVFTLDIRNTNADILEDVFQQILQFAKQAATAEQVQLSVRDIANSEPIDFDSRIVQRVAAIAQQQNLSVKKMPSGAGHDAQVIAALCPAGMIFVPSVAGLSHNVKEFTHDHDIENGANILLQILHELADGAHL
ncbi:Zn-dependent hydrolase [Acinetobacter lactucae]|uniref:Zn-dependent hydrolase n=1 Tax=Acinetobacter lactucae TaxID=1785128 RepID=UPI0021CDCEC7|nr:Zn-dependent hydrolase [Acinetobacter lactucae]MCU4347731.1 Zn-dependent hydrolase [Acinetobacter lactucae]